MLEVGYEKTYGEKEREREGERDRPVAVVIFSRILLQNNKVNVL